MANHPVDSLNLAIRTRLLTAPTIASAGVYYGRIPSGDVLPAVVYFAQPATPHETLDGIAYWDVPVEVIAVAEDAGGSSAQAQLYPLAQAAWEKLDGGTQAQRRLVQAALNGTLAALGYQVMIPQTAREIAANYDTINDRERWAGGHRFFFRIQPV